MKQMYELKNLVTVSELRISDFFLKTNFVSTVTKPAVIKKTEGDAEKNSDPSWMPLTL